MGFSKKQHLQNNIEAIKTVLQLEQLKRQASTEELKKLQKYVGFGGLKCVLHPASSFNDIAHWSNAEVDLFPLVSELHRILQENTPDQKTYKRYIDSIKSSVLTAFYTPRSLVDKIGETLQNNNIKVNTFLDPSAGMGVFLSALRDNNSVAFEKDLLTAKMLQYTHPNVSVYPNGFETIDKQYLNYFDLVSSNIPFGDIAVFDPEFSKSKDEVRVQASKSIHNYFFLKGVDTLREGGLLAYITSQGVLNSARNEPIRRKLLENMQLVSAIRLPNNLFLDNAGTEVGSDFILLQKNSQKQQLSEKELQFTNNYTTEENTPSNRLFEGQKNVLFTKQRTDTDPYGKPATIYWHEGTSQDMTNDFGLLLQNDIQQNFNSDLYLNRQFKKTASSIEKPIKKQETTSQETVTTLYDLFNFSQEERDPNYKPKKQKKKKQKTGIPVKTTPKPPKVSNAPKPFTTPILNHYKEGCLVRFENQIGYLKSFPANPTFHPLLLNPLQEQKIAQYIPIRDTYYELYDKEYSTQMEQPTLRKNLNTYYDAFIKANDYLNASSSVKLLKMDTASNEMRYLERSQGDTFGKADIFFRPVAFNSEEIDHSQNPNEALAAFLNKFSKVDLSYMQTISQLSELELKNTLKYQIHYHPIAKEYQVTDQFLAGNVIQKAKEIEAYIHENANDIEAKESLEALQAIFPRRISFEELDFNLGERWIPSGIYSRFASHLFDTEVNIHYAPNGDAFSVNCKRKNATIWDKYNVKSESRNYDGIALLKHALVNTTPKITKQIVVGDKEVKIPDSQAIQLANSK